MFGFFVGFYGPFPPTPSLNEELLLDIDKTQVMDY
jgi:hypothetical protein